MSIFRHDYESVDSTNEEAKRWWRRREVREEVRRAWHEGRRAGWVFTAKRQTAGRGRLERLWASPNGGLWFTLLWPFHVEPGRYQGLSLAAGLAVAEAVEAGTGVACLIKWPNDLLVNNRKLGGILCEVAIESEVSAVCVGVGVNGNYLSAELPQECALDAATLLQETGRPVDLESLFRDSLDRLVDVLIRFEESGLNVFLPALRSRLAWLDHPVCLADSDQGSAFGTLEGITESGRLLLRTEGRTRSFLTGQLRRHGDGSAVD